jgi:hypothetical protein
MIIAPQASSRTIAAGSCLAAVLQLRAIATKIRNASSNNRSMQRLEAIAEAGAVLLDRFAAVTVADLAADF